MPNTTKFIISSLAQEGDRNALGRAKNGGNVPTPVEDYFSYVREFWTNAIVDPIAPGSGVIAFIEGAVYGPEFEGPLSPNSTIEDWVEWIPGFWD